MILRMVNGFGGRDSRWFAGLTRLAVAVILVGGILFCVPPANQPIDAATREGTLVYAVGSSITKLDAADPKLYPSPYEAVFLIYDNLVRLDKNLKIQPELAERWEVSKDGCTWTFHLRKGVKFHDGTPFDAQAVKFHIDRVKDPATASPNRTLWDHIKSVEVVDDYTIILRTTKPFGPMLNYLAHGSGGIVSPAGVKKWGADFGNHPIGAGPYKLESFTPGVEVVLVRNEDYWGKRPAFDKVVFKYVPEPGARVAMLLTGEADVIADVPFEEIARLEASKDTKVITVTGLRCFFVCLNLRNPILQDQRVREALNYAVDKTSITESIYLGHATVLDSPVAPTIFGYKKTREFPYDPNKARAILASAGWSDTNGDGILDKDGKPLSLVMMTSENYFPKDLDVAMAVQSQLRKAGIDVKLWKVEEAAVRSYEKVPAAEQRWDMHLYGFNPSNGDPSYYLISLFGSNPDPDATPYRWNMMRYSNKKVDALIERSLSGPDAIEPANRAKLLEDIQQILMDESPCIWLYALELATGARRDVQAVDLLPTIFLSLRNTYRSK